MTREPTRRRRPASIAAFAATLGLAASLIAGPALAFEPTLSALVTGAGKPVISGETNLPGGSVLAVRINGPDGIFSLQAKVTVDAGRFKTPPYTDNGKDLAPGKYEVVITMAMASGQPPAVQSVVGKSGEKCTGRLVKLGPFGVYLEQDLSFTVAK